MDFLSGTPFQILYDAVKLGIKNNVAYRKQFRHLSKTLRKLEPHTLEAVEMLNATLNLPNQDILELHNRIKDGAELIKKLSDVTWYDSHVLLSCFVPNSYEQQLEQLNEDLEVLISRVEVQDKVVGRKAYVETKEIHQEITNLKARVSNLATQGENSKFVLESRDLVTIENSNDSEIEEEDREAYFKLKLNCVDCIKNIRKMGKWFHDLEIIENELVVTWAVDKVNVVESYVVESLQQKLLRNVAFEHKLQCLLYIDAGFHDMDMENEEGLLNLKEAIERMIIEDMAFEESLNQYFLGDPQICAWLEE